MALRPFLAMTAAEIHAAPVLPEKLAWMACHFSPYGTGLSNIPRKLHAGSLLILNDRIPIHGHNPQVICDQLEDCISRERFSGLLLDFQRPNCEETAQVVRHLSGALTCTVAVSEHYANQAKGPVFLPPLPHHVPLEEYIHPWKGREIWLELALDGECITITEDGCSIAPLSDIFPECGFLEETLHCHYRVEVKETCAIFTLWRTKEDIEELLKEADTFHITTTVGLFQELC